MWLRGTFTRLSALAPSGQALWLYLLTGDCCSAIPGVIVAGPGQISERRGWKKKDVLRCFREIEGEHAAVSDWEHHLIWLPNGLEYNPPQSVTQLKAWQREFRRLPESSLRPKIAEAILAASKLKGPGMEKAASDLFAFALGSAGALREGAKLGSAGALREGSKRGKDCPQQQTNNQEQVICESSANLTGPKKQKTKDSGVKGNRAAFRPLASVAAPIHANLSDAELLGWMIEKFPGIHHAVCKRFLKAGINEKDLREAHEAMLAQNNLRNPSGFVVKILRDKLGPEGLARYEALRREAANG